MKEHTIFSCVVLPLGAFMTFCVAAYLADAALTTLLGPIGAIMAELLVQLPMAYVAYRYVRKNGPLPAKAEQVPAGKALAAIAAFVLLCCVPTQMFMHQAGYAGEIDNLISILVVAPVAEELFYRGMTFGAARNRLGFVPSAILSAAVFQYAHDGALAAFITIPVAICCCAAYEATGNIRMPMLLHFIFNLLAVLMVNISVSCFIAIPVYALAMLVLIPAALIIGAKAARKAKAGMEAERANSDESENPAVPLS